MSNIYDYPEPADPPEWVWHCVCETCEFFSVEEDCICDLDKKLHDPCEVNAGCWSGEE